MYLSLAAPSISLRFLGISQLDCSYSGPAARPCLFEIQSLPEDLPVYRYRPCKSLNPWVWREALTHENSIMIPSYAGQEKQESSVGSTLEGHAVC